MNCPRCNSLVISFFQWGQGLNAWKYVCPHCGQELRWSRLSKYCFLALIAGLVPITILTIWIDLPTGALFLPYIVLIFVVAFVVWRSKPYVAYDPPPYYQPGDPEVAYLTPDVLDAFAATKPVAVIHVWAAWNGYDHWLSDLMKALARLNREDVAVGALSFDSPGIEDVLPQLTTVPTVLYYRCGKRVAEVAGRPTALEITKRIESLRHSARIQT